MLYFLFLVLFSTILISRTDDSKLKYVFAIIVFALSMLSFFVEPTETWDLFRHYEKIMLYSDTGLDWVIENRLDKNPLTELFLYLFTYVPDHRLFAFCVIFITYGFTFLLLYEARKDYCISRSNMAWISFFLLSNWNYLLVVSNCRIFMLYAIVAYLFYMELVRDKYHKVAITVYIASCFFHYGIMIVVAGRLALYFRRFLKNDTFIVLLSIIMVTGYSYLFSLLGSSVLTDILEEKIAFYQGYTVFGTWQYLSSLSNIILVFCLVLYVRRSFRVKDLFNLISIITIVAIFLHVTNYQIIIRETCLASLLAIIPSLDILEKSKSNILAVTFKLEAVIILLYRCWYEYSYLSFDFVI